MEHIPVLYQEVLDYLQPRPNGRYIDGTVGAGGHTAGILGASIADGGISVSGQVLAFDRDPEAIRFAQKQLETFGDRVHFVNASYATMGKVAPKLGFAPADGILLDLGLSSRQLADDNRGFSFMKEGPLDMRFDATQGAPAEDLINNLDATALADIFWRYGEERHSRRIAQSIVDKRPFTTTTELASHIASTVRSKRRIHPATQVFQALRIAVNQELEEVEKGLETAVSLLKPGGRLAVISFHSLEDRLVKQTFRSLAQDCVCPPQQPVCTCDARATVRLVSRKAIKASAVEIENNPRSRSARLRVAEKLEISD
ncbi:MAG: 16S rRNA (cytosine(1402)-N(4))-methyltransferase RsmH [Chloroflexota bacterium]